MNIDKDKLRDRKWEAILMAYQYYNDGTSFIQDGHALQ